MSRLAPCACCRRHVDKRASTCPFCGVAYGTLSRRALGTLTLGALLEACAKGTTAEPPMLVDATTGPGEGSATTASAPPEPSPIVAPAAPASAAPTASASSTPSPTPAPTVRKRPKYGKPPRPRPRPKYGKPPRPRNP